MHCWQDWLLPNRDALEFTCEHGLQQTLFGPSTPPDLLLTFVEMPNQSVAHSLLHLITVSYDIFSLQQLCIPLLLPSHFVSKVELMQLIPMHKCTCSNNCAIFCNHVFIFVLDADWQQSQHLGWNQWQWRNLEILKDPVDLLWDHAFFNCPRQMCQETVVVLAQLDQTGLDWTRLDCKWGSAVMFETVACAVINMLH